MSSFLRCLLCLVVLRNITGLSTAQPVRFGVLTPIVTFALPGIDPPETDQPVATSKEAERAISAATGAILAGEGPRARGLLAAIPAAELSANDTRFRACTMDRLDGGGIVPATDFTTKVLGAYQRYWQVAVMHPEGRVKAEDGLLVSLRDILQMPHIKALEDADQIIQPRLKAAGLFALPLGKTGFFLDLMLWSSQEEHTYTTQLPEGPQTARVVFLDKFLSAGWSMFLTCGRTGTGGWTKPDGIYTVRSGYPDLNSEDFKVHLLAHESQHFADNARFPGMSSWELEYRAKLVELIESNETRARTLRAFSDNQGDDPASSHSFADKRLLVALRKRLGLPPDDDLQAAPVLTLQAAALAELQADTLARSSKPSS